MKTILLFLLVGSVCTLRGAEPCKDVLTGVASWYGSECSHTATGKRYNPNSLTAAHRTLPIGTRVQVKNLATGRSVTLEINDRGPFRKGRMLDVSKGAAQQLGMIRSGTAKVELAVLQ